MTGATSKADDFLAGIPVAVEPAEIERELGGLWGDGENEAPPDADIKPPSRIATANIVWVGTPESLPLLSESLESLVRAVPSRVIAVTQSTGHPPDRIAEARISARCYLPAPRAPQVCGEIISLTVGVSSFSAIALMVAPLLLPHVSTVIMVSGLDTVDTDLAPLARLGDRLVRMALHDEPLETLRSCAGCGPAMFDFSWFETAHLREVVAGVFDDKECHRVLDSVESITVEQPLHAGDGGRGALLTAGWLASRLGARCTVTRAQSDARIPVLAVTIRSQDGLAAVVSLCETGLRARRHLDDGQKCRMSTCIGLTGMTPGSAIALAAAPQARHDIFYDAATAALAILESGGIA